MRITLTTQEVAVIAELVAQPFPQGAEEVAYTVNQNLTVEKNNAGVTIMRGRVNTANSIYAPGTKQNIPNFKSK